MEAIRTTIGPIKILIHRGQSGPDRADWKTTILGEIESLRTGFLCDLVYVRSGFYAIWFQYDLVSMRSDLYAIWFLYAMIYMRYGY